MRSRILKKARVWIRRRPWWPVVFLALLVPLILLNCAVAYFGKTRVFVLSPFSIPEKVGALARYAKHRLIYIFREQQGLESSIATAASRHRLPPGLLESVVQVESGFEPYRISPAGAMGPGQLMASTAEMLGVDDPFNVATAMNGSARYLAQNLNRFGKIELAVAAYNAGPGSIRAGRIPHNGETEIYVKKVMGEYWRRQLLAKSKERKVQITKKIPSPKSAHQLKGSSPDGKHKNRARPSP